MTPRTRRIREKIAAMAGGNDLLTIADIAAELGVEPVTIRAYKFRGQMPPPAGVLSRTPYWRRADVAPWIAGIKERRASTSS